MCGRGLIREERRSRKVRRDRDGIVPHGLGRVMGRETGSAWVAQLVERVLGKDEVTGSIPVPGSRLWMPSSGLNVRRREGSARAEDLKQHRAGVTQR